MGGDANCLSTQRIRKLSTTKNQYPSRCWPLLNQSENGALGIHGSELLSFGDSRWMTMITLLLWLDLDILTILFTRFERICPVYSEYN